MVGLPARGKSYISRKIANLLNWVGIESKIFNQGVYRQMMLGVDLKVDYFDVNNQDERDKITIFALEKLIDYIKSKIY
jgi:hypothetical protein